MKKLFVLALSAAMLAACSDHVPEERVSENGNAAADALLQVRTRGSDDATVSYPVQVYVFSGDDAGDCRAVQTLGDAGQTLNIALAEGTYSVYAVGGAGSDDYTLPAKDEATPLTAIALNEGRALTDLMSATATATLTDGGTNTVTLGLQRRTMLLQDVIIKQVPTAATAVTVTIAPLWQSLTVCGTYSCASGATTIALIRQDDGRTWQNAQPLPSHQGEGPGVGSVFLLPPSSQPASVSVSITVGGNTTTYTYSTTDQLEAGYKINILGTYTEALGVSLTGTITGATWLGERTISFTFDESGSTAAGSSPNSGPDASAGVPAVGDTYLGCYVLAVTDADDHADLLLLAATELTGTFWGTNAQAEVEAALATLTDGGISGWDVPDRDEARLIFDARGSIGGLTHASYLCENSGYKCFRVGSSVASFSATAAPAAASDTALRAVATVTIAKD